MNDKSSHQECSTQIQVDISVVYSYYKILFIIIINKNN